MSGIGREKPCISLTLGQKEVMKPETIPSSLLTSESATTGVALTDIKGINPSTCMHCIFLKENLKPTKMQICLKPPMMEVVKVEI